MAGAARDRATPKAPPEPAVAKPVTNGPAPATSARDAVADVQRKAGNSAANVYVQLLGTTTKTTYDKLISASKGGIFGKVDKEECLTLVASLRGAELSRAAGDAALLTRLANAFGASEMVRLCSLLPLSLAQKIYWCDKAMVAGTIDNLVLHFWMLMAPAAEIKILLARPKLFDLIKERLLVPPSVVVGGAFPGASILDLYGGSKAAAQWLGRSTASQVIQQIAPAGATAAKVKAAKQRLVEAGLWAGIKTSLPKGAALDLGTKAALLRLAGHDSTEAASLFPIRFDKPLTGTWNVLDVMIVWKQLDVLPDRDVSANTVLQAFQAIAGDAGFWSGGNTVQLGAGLRTSTMGPARLPHTVRHEIGHAVHDLLAGTVNAWLKEGVKFWYHPGGIAGVQSMIGDFGGWPATYQDEHGTDTPFGAPEKADVLAFLGGHINSVAWKAKTALPAAPQRVPGGTGPALPGQRLPMLWEAMPAGLRTSFETSKETWYNQYTTHPRGSNGFTFFNHYYNKPFYFSPAAKSAIAATGDNYSAMSEKEFFANCYAEYFVDPAGATDKSKWGGSLSADVKGFFEKHIVGRQPYKYAAGAGAGASVPTSPNQVPEP